MNPPRARQRSNGLRKAAIMLIVLGEKAASSIYRHLPEEDVEAITEEIASVGNVQAVQADEVLEEYALLSVTQDYLSEGGPEFATRLLVGAYGQERAQALLQNVTRAQELSVSKLDSLQRVDPQQLARFLESEHPQTIALILGHLDAKRAAALLMKLPDQTRGDVVKRLAQLRQFSPEVAQKVSVVLNRKLQSLGEQSRRTYAGFKSVAELMNRLEPEVATGILQSIEQQDPKLSLGIRNLMFTFDDLLSVPEPSIREIVANLDKKVLGTALKGASEQLREHIFRTMSSRAVDMLKEDMDAMGPIRSKDVQQARQEAVEVARSLEASGKIVLRVEGEDEMVL